MGYRKRELFDLKLRRRCYEMAYSYISKTYTGYIYSITNSKNNKKYIGQTSRCLGKRWDEHIKCVINYNSDFLIYEAIRYHGVEQFNFSLLEVIVKSTKEDLLLELNNEEMKFIKELNTITPYGYNTNIGGDVKIRESSKKAVAQYDSELNLINTYESMAEAARINDISSSDISLCCNKKIKSSQGYIWRLIDDIPSEKDKILIKNIIQYDYYGNIINTYKNMAETAILTGINPTVISNCCLGKAMSGCGYIWRFIYDPFNKYKTKRSKYIPVVVYGQDGKYYKTFNSIKEVFEYFKMSPTTLKRLLNDHILYKGYFYYYEKDVYKNGSILKQIQVA